MVVVNVDVVNRNAAGKCLHFVKGTHHLMWKTKKQKLLTHYQFRKAIALAWLSGKKCHELEGEGRKQKCDGSVSTITCSLSSRNSASKMVHINDAALDPTTGALKGRLMKIMYTTLCNPLQRSHAALCVVL